jgi:hypothetical protein
MSSNKAPVNDAIIVAVAIEWSLWTAPLNGTV